jgi:hypothetical protein
MSITAAGNLVIPQRLFRIPRPLIRAGTDRNGFMAPVCCKTITFAQTPHQMKSALYLYNTLTRKKELFEPLAPPFVGMYVCGPQYTARHTSVMPVRL